MTSPKRVGKIEFGLLSPKDIRKMSVRKIIWADVFGRKKPELYLSDSLWTCHFLFPPYT